MRQGRRVLAGLCGVLIGASLVAGCADEDAAAPVADEQRATPSSTAEPPPPHLLDAIWQRVDAGEWTIEEALIRHLRALSEQADLRSLYDDRRAPRVRELTGLIGTARIYAKTGTNPEARTQIRRLLHRLVPDRQVLQALSAPEPGSGDGAWLQWPAWANGIRVAHAMSALCERAVHNAYPLKVTALDAPCFYWREHRSGGSTHYLYYPARWADGDDPRMVHVARAQHAIDDAIEVYSRLGSVGLVDLVFTEARMGSTKAFVDLGQYYRGDNPHKMCLVHVLAPAYDLSAGDFRQAIAHEVFHCFQAWNYPRAHGGADTGLRWLHVTQWWVEGAAEYFSNVVYPANNFEWRNAGRFDAVSPDTPIHRMAYENFLFFQYLGNEIGNREVLDLISGLPASGGYARQAERLAAFGDMQALLHEFGQRYLDSEIRDTGGELIPVHPDPGELHEIGAAGYRFETRPLVLHRARLEFAGGQALDVSVTEEGAPGRNHVSEQGTGGAWREIPERVGTGLSVCQARTRSFQLLMTAAAGGSERYRVRLTLGASAAAGEDLSDAAYRYRNFAGALKMLREGGPGILVPKRRHGFADLTEEQLARAGAGLRAKGMGELAPTLRQGSANVTEEQRARIAASKNPMHCQMTCSLRCVCDHPEFHSTRTITLDECLRYVEGGDYIHPSGPYENRTECERRLELPEKWRPKGFSTIETWCTRTCSENCGWPPSEL